MSIETLLSSLNANQRIAATFGSTHALVLAGAGTGKTRTIIARAGYLIHAGVPPDRIQVLTFTRRSAKEIVERVKHSLGDRAEGLQASTFHTWCMTLIRRMPKLFGCVGHTVIDRDDQLQIFRRLRGSGKTTVLPPAAIMCDIYSFARNTRSSLTKTLESHFEAYLPAREHIANVIRAYEAKKKERRYLDYDDILDVVATIMKRDDAVRDFICQQYDHLLVDEMQDTNPLQWDLLEPLCKSVKLFCVGDDAQSIYGFRGADFRNVHSFSDRVKDSVVLRLEQNYRSTQEILDLSNWLLKESPIKYNKQLVAVRGQGIAPKIIDFSSEWDEARYVVDDVSKRRGEGANWGDHMILTRSAFAARTIETTLLSRNIPYTFIGGTKLLESAHIRDVLSLLRVVANPLDELAWMRYLTLWPKIGDVTANSVIDQFPRTSEPEGFIGALNNNEKICSECKHAFSKVLEMANTPAKAYAIASEYLLPVLQHIYEKDWDKRKGDFALIEKLIKLHTSILSFIEEYLLDPVSTADAKHLEDTDVVCVITIHSAKGTERKTCYVINVTPGSFPSVHAIGDADKVEEERRVLYVALTRAQDELILTRRSHILSATENLPQLPPGSEYVKISKQLKNLITEYANETLRCEEEAAQNNKSKRFEILRKNMGVLKEEIDAKRSRMNVLLEEHKANTKEDAGIATYFLNNLPTELLVSEIPPGRSSSWVDGSSLVGRDRPDVGIDLS